MSDRETFMARWSRRKRASAQEGESVEPSAPADDAAGTPQAVEAPQAIGAPQAVDAPQPGERALGAPADARASDAPASHEEASPVPQLPSIESIVAESDVRAFLAPGVPPELTRAALRRAWSADPKIRDFIGLSENSWGLQRPRRDARLRAAGADGRDPPGNSAHDRPQPWGGRAGCPRASSARCRGARTRACAGASKIRNARLPGRRGTAAPSAGCTRAGHTRAGQRG